MRWWLATLLSATVAVIITVTVERTWSLQNGVGLSQHYGFLTIFATAPFLLLIANSLLEDVAAVLYAPAELDVKDRDVADAFIHAKNTFGSVVDWLVSLVLAFGGCFLLHRNVVVTHAATRYFEQDVFDSAAHPLTFLATKIYLGVLWIVLYPLVVTLAGRAVTTMIIVVRAGIKSRSLNVDFFSTDDCAGMTRIGRLYYKVLTAGLLFSACSLTSFMTHRIYRPQITLLAVASLAVGVISYFAALRPLHHYVVAERLVPLNRIAGDLAKAYQARDWSRCAELLAIRSALLGVNTYALPTSEAVLVFLIPFVQLVIAAWVVVAAPPTPH